MAFAPRFPSRLGTPPLCMVRPVWLLVQVVKQYPLLIHLQSPPPLSLPAGFSPRVVDACCGAPPPSNALVQCGSGLFVTNWTASPYTPSACSHPQQALFWDFVHPSQAMNRRVADRLWDMLPLAANGTLDLSMP